MFTAEATSGKHKRDIWQNGALGITQPLSTGVLNTGGNFRFGWYGPGSDANRWQGGLDEVTTQHLTNKRACQPLWASSSLVAHSPVAFVFVPFSQLYIFSEALTSTKIGEHYAGNFLGAGLATVLGYWRFNEGQGTVAYDSVGTNHLTGGTAVWKMPSAAGKCIARPAVATCAAPGSRTGGFISTRDNNANTVFTSKEGVNIEFRHTDFTVAAWIRRSGTGGQNNWFSVGVSGSSTTGQSLWLGVMGAGDSNFLGMGFVGDTLKATAGPILNDGAAWFYVSYSVGAVATRTAPANKHARQIFRNGVLVGSDISTSRLSPQTNAFKIGTSVASGLTGWTGDIDEVKSTPRN